MEGRVIAAAKLVRTGNSVGVVIPQWLLGELGWSQGNMLLLTVDQRGRLIVEKQSDGRKLEEKQDAANPA